MTFYIIDGLNFDVCTNTGGCDIRKSWRPGKASFRWWVNDSGTLALFEFERRKDIRRDTSRGWIDRFVRICRYSSFFHRFEPHRSATWLRKKNRAELAQGSLLITFRTITFRRLESSRRWMKLAKLEIFIYIYKILVNRRRVKNL